MAISYKKLSSNKALDDVAEDDKWKFQDVEKSVTQSPMKSINNYASVKSQLDDAKAKVAELEADLAEIEAKAKS